MKTFLLFCANALVNLFSTFVSIYRFLLYALTLIKRRLLDYFIYATFYIE